MDHLKILLTLAVVVCLYSCGGASTKQEEAKDRQVITKEADSTKIVGMASVEPITKIVSLYSDVGGLVKKINYDINSEVRKGETIVALNTEVEEAQLAQARSKLATQEASIQQAKAQLASVKAKMENAELTYNRNVNLLRAGAVTQQTTDDSKFTFESDQNDVAAADATIKQQEAKLAELRADIDYDLQVIDRKQIKAPASGRILSLDIELGTNVVPSQSVGQFAPDGPLMAITEVDELFATNVKVGMKAYIRPQGKTDTLATGKVFLASPYLRKKTLFSDDATNMEDRRVREVRVLLDSSDKVLIGSRVECVIPLNQ